MSTPLLSSALAQATAEELTALLQARPDLANPAPLDLGELATRAAAESSTARALDGLNRWQLTVAEALAALPDGVGLGEVAELLQASPLQISGAVTRLRELALVWGPADDLHVLRAVRTIFGPWPGGLAAPSATPLDESEIAERLADLPRDAGPVLDRLQWGPPTGSIRKADRPVSVDQASTPVEHLLARGLLRPTGPDSVILPREVALHRRGRFCREEVTSTAPTLPAGRTGKMVDLAAVGAAIEFVQDVEAAVDDLATTPAALLRSGGLGTREVAARARRLGLDAERYSLVVEVAAAADLLTCQAPSVRATTAFDGWLKLAPLDRLRVLVQAWGSAPRRFAASCGQGHTLGPEADAAWAPKLRGALLALLSVGDAADLPAAARALSWHRPGAEHRLSAQTTVEEVFAEARRLGLIAWDTVTSLILLAQDPDQDPQAVLPEEVIAAFPEPVTQVIIQADLTAVAPGPPDQETSSVLRLLADQESRGGGGVWRFARETIRRGFDAGWSAQAIGDWLTAHSTTGVPQPLQFLIEDVARTHGAIRVGRAASYVRVDDPARLTVLLGHPQAAELGLRQVGPATLIAQADPDEVVELIRSLGLAPAAEDALGEVVRAPGPLRAQPPRRPRSPQPADPASVAQQLLIQAQLSTQASKNTADTLDRLRQAYRERRPLRIDYVAADGTRVSRDAVPIELGAGLVRLHPRASAGSVTVPLARIIQVSETQD